MEWIVKNAVNVDVERQHLNKILKEIKSQVDNVSSQINVTSEGLGNVQNTLTTTITKIINNTLPASELATTVTLTGDVIGTSTKVPGQNAVTIQTTLSGSYVKEAPLDSYAYWRFQGQWQAVPAAVQAIGNLAGPGYLTITDEGSYNVRTITSGDVDRIVITNGDANTGDTVIDLALVPDSGTGTLQLTDFDAYGRKTGTAAATTDDLIEGTGNLYFTVERAQDSVGTILISSPEIDLIYNDSTPSISATLTTAVRDSLDLADSAVQSVVAGTNITIDNTDPQNPIISASGGGTGTVDTIVPGVGIDVDNTDPANPIVTAVGLNVPAFLADGTASEIPLNSVSEIPALLSNGTASNIPVIL